MLKCMCQLHNRGYSALQCSVPVTVCSVPATQQEKFDWHLLLHSLVATLLLLPESYLPSICFYNSFQIMFTELIRPGWFDSDKTYQVN